MVSVHTCTTETEGGTGFRVPMPSVSVLLLHRVLAVGFVFAVLW